MANKRKLITAAIGINVGLIFTSLILGCVAWFASSTTMKTVDVKSSVITSYFDCRLGSDGADGTEDNPYVISRPIHYYNLIELMKTDKDFVFDGMTMKFYEASFLYFEMGKDTDGDGDKEFYAYGPDGVVIEDQTSQFLNMDYYYGNNALSPLGTASKPFRAHIIGNNLTIQGLHIDGTGYSDVGVFGYVSSCASITNLYLDSVDINAKGIMGGESNALYHSDAHSFANIGYIAGHVESDNSFVDVYVNNCKIRNAEMSGVVHNNDYGYFGYAQCNSTPVPSGEGFRYEFNPGKVYDYLDSNYANLAGESLRLRNDYTVGAGTVSNAITKSSAGGTHYGFVGSSTQYDNPDHNYPIANIGYEKGASVSNLWMKESSSYRSIPETVEIIEDAPGDTPGTFMYYNGETWDYYNCIQDTERTTKTGYLNTIYCVDSRPDQSRPMYEWYWGMNNKHYWVKNNNDLNVQSWGGTYFAFIEKPGVFPQPENRQIRSDLNRTVYVVDFTTGYYMYVQKDTMKLKFGSFSDAINPDLSVACRFTMTAVLGGTISFKVGINKYYLYYSNGTMKAGLASETSPSYFYLTGDGCVEASGGGNNGVHGDAWTLVTSTSQLTNNSKVVFAYGTNLTNGSAEVMMNKRSTNYRKAVSNDVRNNIMADSTELGVVTVKTNSDGTYSFYDDANEGYFYAASSTYDYLRTELRNDDPNSHFALTMDSTSHAVSLTAQGDSTHNRFRYMATTNTFTCTESANGLNFYIFKYSANGNPDRVCLVTCNQQNQWGYYGGIASVNKLPIFYSDRPLNQAMNDDLAHRMIVPPEELGELQDVFNFNAYEGDLGFDSTSVVEMQMGGTGGGGDGWVKCTDKSDIEDGGLYLIACYTTQYCATAGPIANGGLSSCTESVFQNNGRVITDPDPAALQFTLHGSSSEGWTIENGGQLLGTTSIGQVNLNGLGETYWNISINEANGFANINSVEESYGHLAYNTEEGNERFTTLNFGKEILIYKRSSDVHDITYIADEIAMTDPYYNCGVIDAVGGVQFYKNGDDYYYAQLDNGNAAKSILYNDEHNTAHGKTGDKYYSSYNNGGSIMVRVPNTGSLDFGTLVVYGEGEAPEFLKGAGLEGDTSLAFESRTVMCDNLSAVDGQFIYNLSLNAYNIYNLSYCALDEDGNILSSYDTSSDQITPDQSESGYIDSENIKTFILSLGCVTGAQACRITKIEYKFYAAQGNMANFGKVGYRTAVYEGGETDNLGNQVKAISVVPGPVVSFEYECAPGDYVFVGVTYAYDAGYRKYVYSITFRSSATTSLIVFNFDAQRELVRVNGLLWGGAYNVIPIAGTTPPTGGWSK